MKKFISMIATIALAFGFTTAFACPQDDPCDVGSISGFEIGSFANFAGFGGSVSTGDQVANLVEKEGAAFSSVDATVVGDGCGLDCTDVSISGTMSAFEQVHVLSAAMGEQSGEPVTAVNEGGAFSAAGFSFQKFNINPQ